MIVIGRLRGGQVSVRDVVDESPLPDSGERYSEFLIEYEFCLDRFVGASEPPACRIDPIAVDVQHLERYGLQSDAVLSWRWRDLADLVLVSVPIVSPPHGRAGVRPYTVLQQFAVVEGDESFACRRYGLARDSFEYDCEHFLGGQKHRRQLRLF